MRKGDTLYITSLDQLSRSKQDIKAELEWFKANQVVLRVLDLPTSLIEVPKGQEWIMDMITNILVEVLASMAEQERLTTDGDEDADEDQLPEIKVKEHTRKPRKPKRCRDDIYAALPVDEVKIPVAKKDRICHDCGAKMKHLGYKTIREELRMIPAKFFRTKLMAETMFCPCCREEDDATIVTAQVPKALLPHSPASQSTVTEVMCQKSDLHVPFYRQEHECEQKGCPLPRETAANWYNTCALEYLLPVYEALHS